MSKIAHQISIKTCRPSLVTLINGRADYRASPRMRVRASYITSKPGQLRNYAISERADPNSPHHPLTTTRMSSFVDVCRLDHHITRVTIITNLRLVRTNSSRRLHLLTTCSRAQHIDVSTKTLNTCLGLTAVR